jgi:Protein of unknown function (DUF3300)
VKAGESRVRCALALVVLALPAAAAQIKVVDPAAPADSGTLSAEQLEQLVAPIALYPDDLLAQMMMAATYPLEIVEAARFREKNPGLTGAKLEDALKLEDWDESVKALCGFPDVLAQMNENLDWTQDLGDAVLGQKQELFDTIQRMRDKAREAGSLESTDQQVISEEGDDIVIESADPEVIYVPTYSPLVVYGPGWYYPHWYYPPYYRPVPPGTGLIIFGAGVAWGHAMWGHCNWNDADIDIDVDHHHDFANKVDRDAAKQKLADRGAGERKFQHDPAHRKGVNYKNKDVAKQFGDGPRAGTISRDEARGFDRSSTPRAGTSDRPGASDRPGTSDRPGASTSRPTSKPDKATTRPSSRSSSKSSALSGSRSPSLDRAGSARGASSRGGSRGGGGRGGGRGGR